MPIELCARKGFTAIMSAALLTVSAWAWASEPKRSPTAMDPSNPAAPESPALALSALSRADEAPPVPAQYPGQPRDRAPAGPASAAEHGHDHGSNASSDKDKSVEAENAGKPKATAYTCPMHPEVVADKPGRCPKCGMKLVPKESPEGKK